jgi:RNA polymerase sigma factor (sigma-70 family)
MKRPVRTGTFRIEITEADDGRTPAKRLNVPAATRLFGVGAMSQRPLHVVRGREAETPSEAPARPDFDGFFAGESERLFRRLWLVTRDRSEAEEIMQDAFLSLYERWDRLAGVEDLRAYLYRTAFNAWNKRSRRTARNVRLAFTPARRDDVDAADARTVVGQALAKLTPRQRAAVVLTELLDLSSEEAGEILGVRAVTARVLTSQARAAMRTYLGGDDG